MSGFPYEFEILVVDDGSKDRTAEEARATGVRVVQHRQNRGYGEALKTGIRHARFERIAIIDADGSYPPQEIPRLAALLDDAEMVVGARTGPNAAIPLIRRPAKKALTMLASYLTGVTIPDLNSGLRLFRRALAIEFFDLLPSKFSFTTTITLAALNSGYLVEYVEVDYYARTGKSKIRPIQDTFNFTMLILRMTLIFRPLKVYLPLARDAVRPRQRRSSSVAGSCSARSSTTPRCCSCSRRSSASRSACSPTWSTSGGAARRASRGPVIARSAAGPGTRLRAGAG